MANTLIKDEKYNGKYVALKDFADQTVVADGKNPGEAFENATKKGYQNPVILFVPSKDMVQIY
jgi:hypothetical protein